MPERSSSILSYLCIMQWITSIGGLLLAYLLGSIPTAVWVGKWFYGCDIRNEGSGNAGATNIIRVLGVKAGIPVILVDVLKGFLAVYFMTYFIPHSWDTNQRIYLLILAGFLAVIGHVYPVFASFKGGKGVATLLGMGIALFSNVIWISLLSWPLAPVMSHWGQCLEDYPFHWPTSCFTTKGIPARLSFPS